MALTTAPTTARSSALQVPAVGGSNDRRQPPLESSVESPEWQEAQERILLYMKLLGMAPQTSLDIARRVLDEASDRAQDPTHVSAAPTAVAMRVLHRLLTDNPVLLQETPLADYPSLYRRWRPSAPKTLSQPLKPGNTVDLFAMPAIKRGFMRTKKI